MKKVWQVFSLSVISKLLENSRMIAHLAASIIMAYYHKHCTETAILKIFNDILLSWLEMIYSFTGHALEWLHTYMSNGFSVCSSMVGARCLYNFNVEYHKGLLLNYCYSS